METATRIKVIPGPSGRNPLLRQYQGQSSPQPARLVLELDTGRLYVEIDPEVGGGVRERIYNGIHRTWPLDPRLTQRQIRSLLRTVKPLAEDMLDGAEIRWNGNNFKGHVGKDTRDVIEYHCHHAELL